MKYMQTKMYTFRYKSILTHNDVPGKKIKIQMFTRYNINNSPDKANASI